MMDIYNMPWAGYWVEADGSGEDILRETGYQSQPVAVWRWEMRGRDAYGYGLTTEAMPEIKTANAMAKTLLKLADKISDPPTFLPESMADDEEVSLEPGAINFFRDPGMRPFEYAPGAGYPVNKDILEMQREKIRSIFKVRYFLMLMQMEQSGRTAYEIRERKVERITAMGSIMGRAQKEYLDVVLARMLWNVLSGGASSRLYTEVREKRGLCYSVGARYGGRSSGWGACSVMWVPRRIKGERPLK
ncbi:MAG: hypothetical protein HC898_10505, partial [Phycisphaerales bacterium]|nr:hypothetical protein [Phycisphaerales bacterium]